MKHITMIISFLMIATLVKAQESEGPKHHKAAELELTESQKVELKTLRTSLKEQVMQIKENEELSHEEKKSAIKDIKEAHDQKRKAVLTEEQLEKAERMRAERRAHVEARVREAKKRHKEEIKPLVDQEAEAFERKLSKKETANVLQIKEKLSALAMEKMEEQMRLTDPKTQSKEAMRAKRNEEARSHRKKAMTDLQSEYPEDYDYLVSLTEKYATDIDEHLRTIKEAKESLREEMKEDRQGDRRHRKAHKQKERKEPSQEKRRIGFLLKSVN